METFLVDRDRTSIPSYSINISDDKYAVRLVAGAESSVVIPAGATLAIFSSDTNFWMGTTTITLPSSTTFAASSAELNPMARDVVAGDTLYFQARVDGDLSIAFYKD